MPRRFSTGAVLTALLVCSSPALAEPAPEAPPPPTAPDAPAAPTSPPAPTSPADSNAPAGPPAPTEVVAPTAPVPIATTAPAAAEPPAPTPASAAPPAATSSAEATLSTESSAGSAAGSTSAAGGPRGESFDPTVPTDTEDPDSWFSRPPIAVTFGVPERNLTLTFYGILQADVLYDTTRSYNEVIGGGLVARRDTYIGNHGRTQISARNSRVGLAVTASPTAGFTPSAVLEGDFRGNQKNEQLPTPSESAFYTSPGFRMRLAYFQLSSDVVDVLLGQTWDLFARQNTFNPGVRNPQVRLSHEFGAGGPVSVDLAAAAVRPVQRDSQLPDGQAALRLFVNDWLGIGTPRGIPSARPLSIAVSAVARQFDVNAFAPPPTQRSNKVVGRGFAVDALVPVIPAEDQFDRGNKLTLMGLFVTGTGIGDLTGIDGGAEFQTLPNPARSNPPPVYYTNIDDGLVSFDILGVLNTIDWQAFQIGAEYYLPPDGRVMLSGNYMEAVSDNLAELYPRGGAEIELLTHVADRFRRADFDVFWNATPEVRLGLGGSFTEMEYLDGERPHNWRARLVGNYYF